MKSSIKQYNKIFFKSTSIALLIGFIVHHTDVFAQSLNPEQNRILVDGVSAVIGDYVILNSDVDKTIIELESQGLLPDGMSKCEILSNLMENRLYQHHAVQDSIEVADSEIYSIVDQNLENFVLQLGSMEKVLEFYDKSDELSFRQEIFEINKSQVLSQRMKAKIIENVEVTPEEVRLFFESIPKEELPVFGTELEISQIVIEPEISEIEETRVINLLRSFKEDVLEKGMSFASKAILYSQDPGSRSSGGKYTLHRKRPRMVKEFRDVAFSLREGEISEPFKTDFGWHILTLDKIRGQEIDVRHILIIPKVEVSELTEARSKIDSIRTRIIDEEISFAEAAFQFSDERETKFNNGVLINPTTGDSKFELANIDPTIYKQIEGLRDGEISAPLLEETESGQKKYKIIKVSNRFDAHVANFTQDYVRVKDLALKDKQFNIIKQWMDEKIKDTYVYLHKEQQHCNFNRKWLKSN